MCAGQFGESNGVPTLPKTETDAEELGDQFPLRRLGEHDIQPEFYPGPVLLGSTIPYRPCCGLLRKQWHRNKRRSRCRSLPESLGVVDIGSRWNALFLTAPRPLRLGGPARWGTLCQKWEVELYAGLAEAILLRR